MLKNHLSLFAVVSLIISIGVAAPVALAQNQEPVIETNGEDGASATDNATTVSADEVPLGNAPDLPAFSVVKYNGRLLDAAGKPVTGTVGVTFAFYGEQDGGPALWMETQTVTTDAEGRYTALIGSASPNGLPSGIFGDGEARWLDVATMGTATTDAAAQPRVLLVSVPYALGAADAARLGGRPADDFVLDEELEAQVRLEIMDQLATEVQNNTLTTDTTGDKFLPIQTFSGNTTDEILRVEQSGTGHGVNSIITNAAPVGSAIRGEVNDLGIVNSAAAVEGVTNSVVGPAGLFRVTGAGGTILRGENATSVVFNVSAAGVLDLIDTTAQHRQRTGIPDRFGVERQGCV